MIKTTTIETNCLKIVRMYAAPYKHRGILLTILFCAALLLLALASSYFGLLNNDELPEQEFLALSHAQALPLDVGIEALSEFEANWVSAEFPFHWRNAFSNTRAVWYRISVSAAQLMDLQGTSARPLWGIYIWRINQTADIWLNGQLIGSGGRSAEVMARYWNSPLYFEIPSSLIQEQNQILIKHFSQHSWGSMETPILAPASALRPIYERRYFVQHDIAQSLFIFVLVTGLFSFFVWFNRQRETQYLWFALSSLGLSFYCVNQFIRYLPVSDNVWRWLTNISIDLWAVTLSIYVLRSLGLHKPLAERIALAYVLIGVPLYFYASFYQVFDINIYFHIGPLLLGIYVFKVNISYYQQTKTILPVFYCSAIALLFIAGAHDTLMQAIVNNGWQGAVAASFQNHFNSVHFAAPVIFMFIAASLIKRFIDSMNAVDRLNEELEMRVERARQELADNYQAIEEVLIKQSASEERERIYRDLHDDVGSKLLSLYYRLEKESDSTLAKSALEDLRDIVSRKSLESAKLGDAVLQWEQEAAERLRDAGVTLQWQFSACTSDTILTELQHAHLRRMLREVFSNALLHSKAITQLNVCIEQGASELLIRVANDGVSMPVADWKPGRGISNLRVRARDLGGEFAIEDLQAGWVQVVWNVPINAEGGL